MKHGKRPLSVGEPNVKFCEVRACAAAKSPVSVSRPGHLPYDTALTVEKTLNLALFPRQDTEFTLRLNLLQFSALLWTEQTGNFDL